jgi:hypothetical protein
MSQPTPPKATIHTPPLRPTITTPSIILYGAIQPHTPSWQTTLSNSLSDLPIAILNPVRSDWDSSWIESITFAPFAEQVAWEMDYAQVADVIVFYFAPEALTPVTLLELGLYAGTGKAVVCCPEGFYKRGNVQVICGRYGIEMVGGLGELGEVVRKRLVEMLGGDAKS